MRVGMFYLPTSDDFDSASDAYREVLQEAVSLEAARWDAIWLAEHHFDGYGGMVPSPAVLAAAIAARTTRLRIGAGAAILPFHDPVRLAEDFAMVDVLSDGRLEMGIGRGFLPHEFAGFEIDEATRHRRFEDGWRTLVSAWSGGQPRPGLDVLPRPLQRPTPPIWVAASTARESFELAGSRGFNLLLNPYTRSDPELTRNRTWYTESWRNAGHDPARQRIGAHFHLYVADTTEAAFNEPKAAIERYLARVATTFARVPGAAKLNPPAYETLFATRTLFGTAAEVLERIARWREFGITDLCLMTRFGGLDRALARKSLERFNRDVLPALR